MLDVDQLNETAMDAGLEDVVKILQSVGPSVLEAPPSPPRFAWQPVQVLSSKHDFDRHGTGNKRARREAKPVRLQSVSPQNSFDSDASTVISDDTLSRGNSVPGSPSHNGMPRDDLVEQLFAEYGVSDDHISQPTAEPIKKDPAAPPIAGPKPKSNEMAVGALGSIPTKPKMLAPLVAPSAPTTLKSSSKEGESSKKRRKITGLALEAMLAHFEADLFPTAARREALAARLDLCPREVQVWFQNRRQRLGVSRAMRGRRRGRRDEDVPPVPWTMGPLNLAGRLVACPPTH